MLVIYLIIDIPIHILNEVNSSERVCNQMIITVHRSESVPRRSVSANQEDDLTRICIQPTKRSIFFTYQ